MSRKDFFLALLIVTIWGGNFTVIKLGLVGVSPLVLAASRFLLAAFPAIFFIKPPRIPMRYWVAYGATVGAGQFGFLFYAMHIGMSAGIASVVLQAQAFFTLLLGALLLHENIRVRNLAGLLIGASGLVLIGFNGTAFSPQAVPPAAFLLTLTAAAFWGISNIIVRHASAFASQKNEQLDMLSLVVWSSLVPPVPLLGLAFWLNPADSLWTSLANLSGLSLFAIFYLAFGATLFGYSAWSSLLSRYPASKVAPLSLLVPVTGLLTAILVLGETLSLQQWIGCSIVCAGLALSMFGLPRWKRPSSQD